MAGVTTSLITTTVTCPLFCSSPLSKSLEQAVIEETVRVRYVYVCSLFFLFVCHYQTDSKQTKCSEA